MQHVLFGLVDASDKPSFIYRNVMQYTEWKSFAECLPKENYGLLIKFAHQEDDLWEVNNKLFYGYIFPKTIDSLYIIAEIDNMSVTGMSWKAYKEFNNDQIFWWFNSSALKDDKENDKDYDLSFYGQYIKISPGG